MANYVIAYNPCFSCDKKKCEICELDMHRKRVFRQSEGEWVLKGKFKSVFPLPLIDLDISCSACGYNPMKYAEDYKKYNFCPNCGAKMKEVHGG